MYKDAATACETALQKGDNSWGKEGVALGWNQYGNALTGLKKYEEALATLNRAIAIKPDYASAWTNRSVTLWHQGKNDEALASNQRALELDPNSTQAWYNQGRILTSLLDSEENIIAAYNRALKGDGYVGDNSMLAEIWVNQSAVLLRMKRYKDATVAADNALVFNSKYPEAWYNRAIGFMALREYQKALDSYGRAINIDGKNANFWAGKGIALRFLQRYPDSLVALKKALELNPNHPQALINQDIVMQKIQPPIP
jgi:tetratricopeptide (TPR) repeat protein